MKPFLIILIIVAIAAGGWWFLNGGEKDGGVIKIGALAPLTGDLSVLGERMRNGMELAREDLLNEGIVDSLKIIYEDACLPKDALSAAQKLIQINKVQTLGGSFCLVGLVPILPLIEEYKTITFNTAANPDSVLNKPYLFSTNFSVQQEAKKLAEYAYISHNARTAAIIYFNTPFGVDYNKYFTEYFEKQGGAIVLAESHPFPSVPDFRTKITKLNSENPDIILVIELAGNLGTFLKQAKELGIQSQIIGHYEAEDPTVLECEAYSPRLAARVTLQGRFGNRRFPIQ